MRGRGLIRTHQQDRPDLRGSLGDNLLAPVSLSCLTTSCFLQKQRWTMLLPCSRRSGAERNTLWGLSLRLKLQNALEPSRRPKIQIPGPDT